MTNARGRLSAILVAGAALTGCEPRTSHRWDVVDTPQPVPKEVPAPALPGEAGASEDGDAENCKPGTGRNPEGVCESLHTRDAGYVQQVEIPSGDFVMGFVPDSYDTRAGREHPAPLWSGQPPRRVHADAFWIDLHEVTRKAYAKCVEDGACTPAECPGGENPVADLPDAAAALSPQTCVTHEQAETFCEAHGGHLPSEAQWEYAARGVDGRRFPWGNNLDDSFQVRLQPVGGPVDLGYFRIRGMGSNATEWVADAFDPDAALAPFEPRGFRRKNGPLREALGDGPLGYVVKAGRVGARVGAVGADPLRGFRCAADLGPDDVVLTVPAEAPRVPLVVGEGLQVFGGVADVVDHREAAAFCKGLTVEDDGKTYDDWRLPTLAEIVKVAEWFRGPGPFWTKRGAAVERAQPSEPRDSGETEQPPSPPKTEWVDASADEGEALAARCVRGSASGA